MKLPAILCALILAALSALSAAAQPTPRAAFQLNAPENGANVTEPDVLFSWEFVENGTSYKTTVKNLDGSQAITLMSTDADCFMHSCGAVLYPADHNWLWKEGSTYQWFVKAKDAGGQNLGRSNTRTFVVDMLEPIVISSPADGETVILMPAPGSYGFEVEFAAIEAAQDFFITLYGKNGTVLSTTNYYGFDCAPSCTLLATYNGLTSGQTKKAFLRITSPRAGVKGKMKSQKVGIKLYKP